MEIHAYTRISDIAPDLERSAFTKNDGRGVYFFVPARPDIQMLRDILLKNRSFGSSSWHIWRWSDLYREIWADNRKYIENTLQRRQIDPPDHWIIVRHILAEYLAEIDSSNHSDLPPGIRTRGFISTLGQTLRELLREEVTPNELASSLGCHACPDDGSCPFSDIPEGLLCRLYHSYSSYLETGGPSGLFDSAQIATLTREILESVCRKNPAWAINKNLIFTGFSSFNHSQKKLVDSLEAAGCQIAIYTPLNGTPGSYTVRDQFPHAEIFPHADGPMSYIEIAGGDRRIEMETIARELVMWSTDNGHIPSMFENNPFPGWSNTGMSIPDPYLATAVEVLERYHIPHNCRHGLKVAMTPLWEMLRRIHECSCEGWPGKETLRLLREPWFAGPSFIPDTQGIFLPEGRRQWTETLSSKNDLSAENFSGMCAFSDAVKDGREPAGLLGLIIELAEICKWEKKISQYIIDDPRLDEKCRQFNAALREVREKTLSVEQIQKDIGRAGDTTLKGNEAFNYLSNWARETTIWHRPGCTDSMEVFTGTPPVFAEKELWIFCGASSTTWPGNLRESPLLPDGRKDMLHSSMSLGSSHLPLLSEQRKQREMLFNRICACGKKLTIISYPLTDSSGRPQASSPFIRKAQNEHSGKTWIQRSSENYFIHRGPGKILPGEDEKRVGENEIREKDLYPDIIKERKLPVHRIEHGGIPSVSLSSVDQWKKCPFRYYCMYILRIGEEGPSGFDPLTAGMLLHELWRRTWKETDLKKDTIKKTAERLLSDVTSDHYPELLEEPSLKRHRTRLAAQVQAVGSLQDMMEKTGYRDKEISPFFEYSLPSLEINGVIFEGRLDRLDIMKDGSGIICDYKSGNSFNFKDSLQLPAYTLLLEKGTSDRTELPSMLSGYCYICHGDGKLKATAASRESADYMLMTQRSRLDMEVKVRSAEEDLGAMAEDIKTGSFRPNYNSDTCRYCQFKGICRKYEATGIEDEEVLDHVD